jgi:hypothetical protein
VYSLDEELDAFVARLSPPSRVACRAGCTCRNCQAAPCGCASCGGNETAPVRNPRAARGQTSPRAAGSQLPGWRGWSAPVRLSEIIAARDAGPNSAQARALSPFLGRGSRVYRITRFGIDRDRALNIGMTRSNSILDRMLQHHGGRGGDPAVHAAIRNLPQSRILVQAANLTRQGMHPRRAKLYENWLQDRERPILYNANTTSFENADDGHHFT